MAETKPEKKRTRQSAKSTAEFTDDERAAMRERAQELKAQARRGPRSLGAAYLS